MKAVLAGGLPLLVSKAELSRWRVSEETRRGCVGDFVSAANQSEGDFVLVMTSLHLHAPDACHHVAVTCALPMLSRVLRPLLCQRRLRPRPGGKASNSVPRGTVQHPPAPNPHHLGTQGTRGRESVGRQLCSSRRLEHPGPRAPPL